MYDFGSIEFSFFLHQDVSDDEEVHQVASCQILHNEVKIALILERIEQVYDPFSTICQNISLSFEMNLLVLLDHLFLLEAFNCDDPVSFLFPA